MQNKASSNLNFENDSNLRGIPSVTTMSKPDSQYIQELNQIVCNSPDTLIQDNSNNTYEQDTLYCFNNGEKKKLVQWKKVDNLWINRNLTNGNEYKEVDGKVCKIITPGCDSNNTSEKCELKCFIDDKTTKIIKV